MKVAQAIDSYLKQVKDMHAESTYRGYNGRLKTLRSRHGDNPVSKLKPKHIEKWIHELTHWPDGSPKANDTIRLTVIAWEQLQKHLLELGEIKEPIFDFGKKPGGRRRSKLPTKLEQAKIFRQAIRSRRRAFSLIFHCLRICGARPGELVKANIGDWQQELGYIELKEHKTAKKTQETRKIGVGRTMARLLTRAIGERTSGPIFTDEKGNRWKVEKLSRIYSELRNKLGISKEVVLYYSRHEHGTMLCQRFGIAAAQHSLGHRDIQTTQRYVHPDPAQLAQYQDSL